MANIIFDQNRERHQARSEVFLVVCSWQDGYKFDSELSFSWAWICLWSRISCKLACQVFRKRLWYVPHDIHARASHSLNSVTDIPTVIANHVDVNYIFAVICKLINERTIPPDGFPAIIYKYFAEALCSVQCARLWLHWLIWVLQGVIFRTNFVRHTSRAFARRPAGEMWRNIVEYPFCVRWLRLSICVSMKHFWKISSPHCHNRNTVLCLEDRLPRIS